MSLKRVLVEMLEAVHHRLVSALGVHRKDGEPQPTRPRLILEHAALSRGADEIRSITALKSRSSRDMLTNSSATSLWTWGFG